MKEQITAGKIIGGEGCTEKDVNEFYAGARFYGIPSSAVAKGGDPIRRIVHDYG